MLNTPTPIVLENVTISQAGTDFVDYTQSNNLRASTFDIDFDNENGQTSKVQIIGLDNMIGETEVAEDGSFYLEITADQPVRFQTVNENGEIVRGPSSWLWVRPNERRGCVGCHEDREMAPQNVVPKAIEKAPVAMIK